MKNKIAVLKFGGASIVDKNSLLHIQKITQDYARTYKNVYVIVSAPKGQTRKLKSLYDEYHTDPSILIMQVKEYMYSFWEDMGFTRSSIEEFFFPVLHSYEAVPRDMLLPFILHLGEYLCANVLDSMLEEDGSSMFFDAKDFLATQGSDILNQEIDIAESFIKFGLYHNRDFPITVIPGFYGHNEKGITLLGFDGSDYTAIGVATILGVKEIHLFKNLGDGEFTLQRAHALDEAFGAKTVAPKAYSFSILEGIEIQIRNINKPEEYFVYTE